MDRFMDWVAGALDSTWPLAVIVACIVAAGIGTICGIGIAMALT